MRSKNFDISVAARLPRADINLPCRDGLNNAAPRARTPFQFPKAYGNLKANILPMQPLCGCLIQLPPNGNDSCFSVGRTTVAPAISIDPS
jgi:hypothetical protein